MRSSCTACTILCPMPGGSHKSMAKTSKVAHRNSPRSIATCATGAVFRQTDNEADPPSLKVQHPLCYLTVNTNQHCRKSQNLTWFNDPNLERRQVDSFECFIHLLTYYKIAVAATERCSRKQQRGDTCTQNVPPQKRDGDACFLVHAEP